MNRSSLAAAAVAMFASGIGPACAAEITIATVNNPDLVRMQKLSNEFEKQNPGIDLNWLVLDENNLRQRLTTDIATHGGQFDIVNIGTYEVPIWAERNWLLPLDALGSAYEVDDLIPNIRASLSYRGNLYAAPFIGESSFTMYRTDLFEAAGLEMPEHPTWEFVIRAADRLTDRSKETYGICLRGKPGWGENMAIIAAMANSYGARWFDEKWKPQFDQPEWRAAIRDYVNLVRKDAPPGAASAGFNENLSLFDNGKCAIWIDDTAAGSYVSDPKQSGVHDRVGFALAPHTGLDRSANWLWSWALAIPASSRQAAAAQKFIAWATSRPYAELVASEEGWSNAPAGTRLSLYRNSAYLAAAPFAKVAVKSIEMADADHPTVKPVPYVGVTYPSIPEYPSIGTQVGQIFSEALTGQTSVDDALSRAQAVTSKIMTKGGYYR